MDFDEIKKTWKESVEDKELLNRAEIEEKLKIRSKSNTALNKVRLSYKFELILGFVMAVFFLIWMIIYLPVNQKIIFSVCTIVFFGMLLSFTWRSFNKVRKTVISTDQLKPALLKTIHDIERYVNFNMSNFTKYLVMPFAIFYGMVIGTLVGSGENFIKEMFTWSEILIMLLFLIISSAILIPLSQYLTKRMYKRHLDELKQYLKEFEEIEA